MATSLRSTMGKVLFVVIGWLALLAVVMLGLFACFLAAGYLLAAILAH